MIQYRYAEFWAHCRPHCSGHQMHFDSDDEGRDGIRNPIISTVLYLNDYLGGPTLVTNQSLTSDKLANKGWMVFPKRNRLCMFDGKMLHGVIPGRGPTMNRDSRRITLMLAFWKDIKERDAPEKGSCRKFPSDDHPKYSWHKMFDFGDEIDDKI